MPLLIKDMEMPHGCENCPLLDPNAVRPRCLANMEQQGYSFNTKEERMPTCPLSEPYTHEDNNFILFTCSKCGRKYGVDNLKKYWDEEWGFNYYVSNCPDCGQRNETNDCYWR